MDPFERADIVSDQYNDWLVKNDFLIMKATVNAAAFPETFVAYPPSQPPASFAIDQIRKSVGDRIAAGQRKTE